MVRIGRRAILADRRARVVRVVEPVVAVGAKAAQLAEPERSNVASVRLDVVGNGRGRYAAGVKADPAERLPSAPCQPAVQYQRWMCGACGIERSAIVPTSLTLAEKALCRQCRGMWPFDSVGACICVVYAVPCGLRIVRLHGR
jgi:hypothetical protein